MKCKAYPSSKKHNRYVIAPVEKEIADLPKQAKDEIGTNKAWKEIDLDPNHPLIGLDPRQALGSIESHGYYVQEVTIIFEEK
ncbi:MAG: YcgL domain-containing protein [Sedimentisphaerales bacterium]